MESSGGAAPPASSDDASGGSVVVGKGGRARLFPCLFCNKTFLKSQALGGHQNAHKKQHAVSSLDPYASSYADGIELEARAAGASAVATTSSTLVVAGSWHCGGAVAVGDGACRSPEAPHWAVPADALRSETVERWSGNAPPATVRCVPDHLDYCGNNQLIGVVDVVNWTRSRSSMAAAEEASNSKGTMQEPDLELRL